MATHTDKQNFDPRPDLPMGTRLREVAHSVDTDSGPVLVEDNQLRDLLRALAAETDAKRVYKHAPWCTFDHEGDCPGMNTADAMRAGKVPMPPVPGQR